ncbi:MAG: Hsp70 family protein [Mycobacterium sp.]
MNDGTKSALGLSVGATQLTAVTADNAVSRTPVLTLFAHRPPEVGLPSETGLSATERGLTIGDFVDRVGDPVAILAADGSSHRSETLLADALRAIAYTATSGRALPDVTVVTHPAHWRPAAVAALRRALAQVPEWSRVPVTLLPDVSAAVTALAGDPGLPTRGVIAVCDFGGSGTNLTLVDAGGGYRPIGAVLRHQDFSGDLIDQALLSQVIGDLAGAGAVDLASTSAIGSLTRLRAQCRAAKERLAAGAVTALSVELPGYRGEVRLTRDELDVAVRAPMHDVVALIDDTLRRNGIRAGELVAVATVGGGARMAAVTTALSEQLRVPVVTTPRPTLSAAIGAALRGLRGPEDDNATAMAPAAPATMAAAAYAHDPAPQSAALAWSQADDLPDLAPALPEDPDSLASARPQIAFEEEPEVASTADRPVRWYRSPVVLMAAAVLLSVGTISAVGVVLADDAMTTPSSSPTPSIATTPDGSAPAVVAQPPAVPEPAPQEQNSAPDPVLRTVTAVPPPVIRTQIVAQPAPAAPPAPPAAPVTETVTETPPPPPAETPPPSTEAPLPPSAEPTTEAPPPPSAEPTTEPPVQETTPPTANTPPPWLSQIPKIPTIPGLPPFVPQLTTP